MAARRSSIFIRQIHGLHQRVAPHWLVQVQRGQALHVESGQPHGADEGDTERMLGFLELLFQVTLDHLLAVRRDVRRFVAEVLSFGELGHFPLFLRHHHAALGGLHPGHLFAAGFKQAGGGFALGRELAS